VYGLLYYIIDIFIFLEKNSDINGCMRWKIFFFQFILVYSHLRKLFAHQHLLLPFTLHFVAIYYLDIFHNLNKRAIGFSIKVRYQ
jgi:hypothetical protein